MASGEGRDKSVAEWRKRVLKGDFVEVVKCWKKDQGSLSLVTVVSIIGNSTTFISNSKDDKFDVSGWAEFIAFCCQFIAELDDLTKTHNEKDLFIKILTNIYYNLYHDVYGKGHFDEASVICQHLLRLAKRVNEVDEDKRKTELRKKFLELGSIAWNTAFKLQDAHGCPKIDLCVTSIELSVTLDATSTPTFCDRVIRALRSCRKNLPHLKDLLEALTKTCEPLMTFILTNDSFKKQLAATVQDLLHNLDVSKSPAFVQSKLAEVNSLFPQSYTQELTKFTKPYLTTSLLLANSSDPKDLSELNSAIQEDDTNTIANNFCNLFNANKLNKIEGTSEFVSSIQEICYSCLAHLSKEMKFQFVTHILLMSSAHVPKSKKVNGWIDTCGSSLNWVVDALESTADDLVEDNPDLIAIRKSLLHNIFVVSWNFYNTANCCHEAYILNKFFLKHAFELAKIKSLSQKEYEELMTTLNEGTKFISICLVSHRPGREKEMAKEALKAGVKLLKCSAKAVECLPQSRYKKLILCSVKKWCEVRILAAKVLTDRTSSTIDIMKKYGQEIDPIALEIILCSEIETFSQERNANDFLKVSQVALETLEPKSKDDLQQRWTKLAIAQAKCKSDDVLDVTTSCTLAQEVIKLTEKKVKKDPCLESLVLLVLANHQEFLSNLKAKRLKHKELGDVPLTVRSQKNISEDEKKTCEVWENAVELSQLGQVLSCRQENKDLRPLSLVVMYCSEILKLRISSEDTFMLEPVLQALEASGLHFTNAGHEWCAIKCWNCMYLLASLMDCPQSQLRALGWLIQKYNLESDDKLVDWLLKTGSELKKKIAKQSDFSLHFFDICLAQCYANSGKQFEAAHIVLRLRREIDHNKYFVYTEIMCRTFLVASQLMGLFSCRDEMSEQLASAFVSNVAAAKFAFEWSSTYVSTTKPADRDLLDLRLTELMISSGLVLAYLSNMSCDYKTSCSTLQIMLQKVQKLHFSTRVAQLLSLLGDLDILIPDTVQVKQRLFWNEKILNLGMAIVGETSSTVSRDAHPSVTPTKVVRKEHQLTASCSAKCQLTSSCILCKNPLFQICKMHYLFLSSNNKEGFWALFSELEKANTLRTDRLTSLAWNNIVSVTNRSGWMQMLQGPLELLKHRQVMTNAAKRAANSKSAKETLSALKDVLVSKEQIKKLTMPLARYLENWATAEEVAIGIQLLEAGPWNPQLQTKSYSLSPEYNSEEDISRPCSPVPNIVLPSKPPKPRRKGRKPLLIDDDESIYIAPANAPKITVIDLSDCEESPEQNDSGTAKKERLVPKRNLLKTCKKPEKLIEDRDLQPDPSPVLPTRTSKRQLNKPSSTASKTPLFANSKKKVIMTAVKKPPSKLSTSSSDSPDSVKQPAKSVTRKRIVDTADSSSSSSEVIVNRRRVRRISSSSPEPETAVKTRSRRK
ncbi:uncharacterized protein LOC135937099 [Cloeon dipterum]|uniref:uncharacterized protein LOC135937099 n=1 Tax=Cloeon dipterum TaxID=197152 RepID=UPI0032204096